MSVLVRVPRLLRPITNDQSQVKVESHNLAETIEELNRQFPGVRDRLLDESGALHRFVQIYINGEDASFLEGLRTKTQPGDEVTIVPAVAGGG